MKGILEKYQDIITKIEVLAWDSEPTSYRYKAELTLIDDSKLILKDYIFTSGRKYSFHWQDREGDLIIRWDNATHWKDIDTFPHHKHDKNGISPSQEVTLEDVMNHIYKILKG
jgi:hypothetical protein